MAAIGIIGAGKVGRALGAGWAAGGHAVRYGVPDPADAKHAGLGARVVSVAEAAGASEIVVLATPWAAAQDALAKAGDLGGKVVIDCTNPLAFDPVNGLHLALGFDRSGGELVAGWAPGAAVFKTLNQTGAENMQAAAEFDRRPAMFVAGDDEARKPAVMRLVEDLGFEAFDAGPLRNARLLEPYAMVWIDQALKRNRGRDFAFAVVRRAEGGRP